MRCLQPTVVSEDLLIIHSICVSVISAYYRDRMAPKDMFLLPSERTAGEQ